MVIWLLGLSGSGKTTLGRALQKALAASGTRAHVIDGDEVRAFFENDLGYSEAERRMNVKRIIFAAYSLAQNDIVTIVCNISPFEDLRLMAKRKIPRYLQIYLKRDLADCAEKDVKGVYRQAQQEKSQLVGKEIGFDPPSQVDLEIRTDQTTPDKALEQILKMLREKKLIPHA